MGEAARIEDQLRRAFEGEAWHGPSVRELLAGMAPGIAAARPLPGAHSIWEIVHHVAAWQAIAARRLQGERVVNVPATQDWPPVAGHGAEQWAESLRVLEESHRRLRDAVARLDDRQLDQVVPGTEDSVYVLLHGVAQHDLYHAGQIAILKKASAGPR